jgi:DNA mismatch repair ATPase MutS
VNNLLTKIRNDFEWFFKLDEFLSTLDLLISLAEYALTLKDFSKPKFDEYFLLENSIHPFIKKLEASKFGEPNNKEMPEPGTNPVSHLIFPSSLVMVMNQCAFCTTQISTWPCFIFF